MKQISTPNEHGGDFYNAMRKEKSKTHEYPRKQTLNLLRQFACSYYVEKSLPEGLCGMILN